MSQNSLLLWQSRPIHATVVFPWNQIDIYVKDCHQRGFVLMLHVNVGGKKISLPTDIATVVLFRAVSSYEGKVIGFKLTHISLSGYLSCPVNGAALQQGGCELIASLLRVYNNSVAHFHGRLTRFFHARLLQVIALALVIACSGLF